MTASHGPYQVYAGYRQFYLLDFDQPGDTASPDFWTQEAFDCRLAVQTGAIGVGTDTYGEVPVTVEILDTEPRVELRSWAHVAEASLNLSAGRLMLAGCPNTDIPVATFSLAPRWFRVRACSAGLYDPPASEVEYCGDSYLVQVWPSVFSERVVLKQFGKANQAS